MQLNTAKFVQLHQQNQVLRLVNVWDAASLVLAQKAGAQSVATSSAALAWSLGYSDGSSLPVEELLPAVKRLLRVSHVPISIDLEQGYSNDAKEVAYLVKELAMLGVAGVNLEDGNDSPDLLAQKIKSCREHLGDLAFFINARTDVYLAQLCEPKYASSECVSRLKLYEKAGASGVFIPGFSDVAEVSKFHSEISLPINLMGWPAGVSESALISAGVMRISAGPSLCIATYNSFLENAYSFLEKTFSQNEQVDYVSFNTLF